MIIYFGLLAGLFIYRARSLWREKDGGALMVLITVTVFSAAAGGYYYFIH